MRILTVCLGNICRSPTAAAALREAAAEAGVQIEVDSAGTGDYHVGEPPDPRMVAAAAEEGLVVAGTARQVTVADLEDADLVLAMDTSNLAHLRRLVGDGPAADRIRLLRDFGDEPGRDVPDPYYGGTQGFRDVVGITRAAARGVVEAVRDQRR